MKNLWESTDLSVTVKDFEFTRNAVRRMGSVVYSAAFEEMDSGAIFNYLLRGMELVSFRDYLKRYLYERARIDLPFRQVDDRVYQQIIMDSFRENGAPHSFEPITKKWSAVVKRWLTQDSVRRPTVFLLGFGLRMSPDDVSEFLTKVLKEEDFRLSDPKELIFRYCFANDYRYSKAQELLQKYENLEIENDQPYGWDESVPGKGGIFRLLRGKHSVKNSTGSAGNGEEHSELVIIENEESLLRFLARIKKEGKTEDLEDAAYRNCMELCGRAKRVIARIYQADEEEKGSRRQWTEQDITSSDMEKVISSGIPVNGSGNLQKMSASLLNSHFRQRRFTRQRMDGLEKRAFPVERFDLITLLFFVYSQEQENEEPEIRCRAFMDEMNGILKECGMMELYPVNPYEAFILMCLLSESPLGTYSDIWEMSYQEEE